MQAPLESLIQRPARVRVAQAAIEQAGPALVQTELDLARDVKLAHAELWLAQRRATLTSSYLNTKLTENPFCLFLAELPEHLIPKGRVTNLLLVQLCGFLQSLGRASGTWDKSMEASGIEPRQRQARSGLPLLSFVTLSTLPHPY
ncbi:MAG: hypothetical protein HY235_21870 [Acidobacteria bacterium]|nr:hypothetical protein [Acidobacteriota bacterium]